METVSFSCCSSVTLNLMQFLVSKKGKLEASRLTGGGKSQSPQEKVEQET